MLHATGGMLDYRKMHKSSIPKQNIKRTVCATAHATVIPLNSDTSPLIVANHCPFVNHRVCHFLRCLRRLFRSFFLFNPLRFSLQTRRPCSLKRRAVHHAATLVVQCQPWFRAKKLLTPVPLQHGVCVISAHAQSVAAESPGPSVCPAVLPQGSRLTRRSSNSFKLKLFFVEQDSAMLEM